MDNGADSEQIEALRDWWRKNGRFVVTGVAIAVLVIVGWWVWNSWQASQARAASELYATVVMAEQKADVKAIVNNANSVLTQYPNTAYAALAGLALAKAEFVQQHYAKARQALTRVISQAPDPGFASIARLRLARIQLQQGDAQVALATLDEAKIAKSFTISAATLRGETYLAMDRIADARVAWQTAQAMSEPGSGRYSLLAMRLASLPSAQSGATTKPVVKASSAQTTTKSGATSAATVTTGTTS